MKTQYWYYRGSDIIGTGEEEKKMREERAKKRRDKGTSRVRIRAMGENQTIWYEMGRYRGNILSCKTQIRREHGKQGHNRADG